MIAQKVRQIAGFGESTKVVVRVEMTEAEADRLIILLQETNYIDLNTAPFTSRAMESAKDLLDVLENCV